MIPELETDRLRLRAWRMDDFDDFAAYSGDAEWNKYRHEGVDTVAAWNEFAGMMGEWVLRGYGPWAVEAKDAGRAVGYAGFWHPIDLETPEIYWGLYREASGKGYASEAARAAMDWWIDRQGGRPLVTYCHPENTPSRRVAERLGGRLQGTVMLRGMEDLLFRYPQLEQLD